MRYIDILVCINNSFLLIGEMSLNELMLFTHPLPFTATQNNAWEQ